MRTADGFSIHLAHAPVQDLTFLDKLATRLRHNLDRRIRIDTVLIEHTERLHAEIAQGVFAHAADVCRSAVLFRLHLHAVHEFMPELR